jgi:GNAT superfamily N-acetyltransferase
MVSSRIMVAALSEIRAVLNADPAWCLYALGDLDRREHRFCDWQTKSSSPPAIVLIYHGFPVPVLFAFGAPRDVEELLQAKPPPAEVYLHVRPEITLMLRAYYRCPDIHQMVRMVFRGSIGEPSRQVSRLGKSEIPALLELYEVRRTGSEDAIFFDPRMVSFGCYYGIWDEKRLVAVAGTHLLNETEGVAAIGNIFCHPNYRGQGLGRAVATAVLTDLAGRGIQTIGLNVATTNQTARRLYQSLGFVDYCHYHEGKAQIPKLKSPTRKQIRSTPR